MHMMNSINILNIYISIYLFIYLFSYLFIHIAFYNIVQPLMRNKWWI